MPLTTDEKGRGHSIGEIENWNLDRSVEPPTKVVGLMAKDDSDAWVYLSAGANRRLMVSGTFASTVTGGISASESLSARCLEGTAHIGQVSAILVDNPVNATYLGRVSAVGATFLSANQQISSYGIESTGHIGSVSAVPVDDGTITKFLGRVSALGVTASLNADATNNRVSAFQTDAGLLRVSALVPATVAVSGTVNVNGIVPVSGTVTANVNSLVGISGSVTASLAASQALSALLKEGTAHIGQVSALQSDGTAWLVSAHEVKQSDGASLRVSNTCNDASINQVSAKSLAAATMYVSAFQTAAANMFTSAFNTGSADNFRVSAFSKDGGTLRVSSVQTDGANQRTSCFSNDGALLRASSVMSDAAGQMVSAKSNDAALLRVSSIQTTDAGNQRVSCFSVVANAMVVSAKSADAGTLLVSAYLPVNTVGQMTAFRSLSLSASQAIKATAGAIYGYYLWNTTTVPQYVKFTSTSGAINVGTDVPVFGAMLPASAAANAWFGQGIKGFTAGIGVHATSAVADNATTPAAASAVGGTIFYN